MKSVFEAAANARPESEEDMMLSQKPGFFLGVLDSVVSFFWRDSLGLWLLDL